MFGNVERLRTESLGKRTEVGLKYQRKLHKLDLEEAGMGSAENSAEDRDRQEQGRDLFITYCSVTTRDQEKSFGLGPAEASWVCSRFNSVRRSRQEGRGAAAEAVIRSVKGVKTSRKLCYLKGRTPAWACSCATRRACPRSCPCRACRLGGCWCPAV
jgi:hypothetical protein